MISLKEITGRSVFIIAEIGNNHNGSKDTAKKLIDIAGEAGVDAVKFQTFTGLDIVSPKVKASEYPGWDVKHFEYWYQFIDSIALPLKDHAEVYQYAAEKGLIPFSTPTSVKMVDFLESIDNSIYKIASMDITNIPLLKRVAATGKPVILSTGMSDEDELIKAVEIFSNNELAVLHCISDYPVQPENVNLLSVKYITDRYKVISGLSDHAVTNEFAAGAVALGGRIIEKHITVSRQAKEKAEHHFSLEPAELKSLVQSIRNMEKGLGTQQWYRSPAEAENKTKYRRSLHLNKDKKAGEIITPEDISVVRPALGDPSADFDLFIGKKLTKDVAAWTGLRKKDISE